MKSTEKTSVMQEVEELEGEQDEEEELHSDVCSSFVAENRNPEYKSDHARNVVQPPSMESGSDE